MSKYTFNNLNDKEFESLSIILLSKELNTRIERFKSGKDSGVDGRFFENEDKEIIIQCKHWLKTGINSLISHLKKVELSKVKKLNPSRYIFITSLELSRNNKRIIKEIFDPYIQIDSDVYGNEDLNDLLSQYNDIEKRFYKLWLSNTNVLNFVLHNGIISRSINKLSEINDFSCKYVLTENHNNAIKKLEELHSIIIVGESGVGKTTLAEHLNLYYSFKGYELIVIENSLNEAESIFQNDKKQLFYFDDFLGRNYFTALNSKEDSHVINFIKRISKNNSKRFILTSRTNILNQGKRLSDLFNIENINRNEFELNINSYSLLDKAKILYNHIWFSALDQAYIDSLYFEKRYHLIIKHKNFNPRIISFITDHYKLNLIPSDRYWSYIESTLNNPKDIWENVFNAQLDCFARDLVTLVVFNGGGLYEKDLRNSYHNLIAARNYQISTNLPSDFDFNIRLIVGALLNRNYIENNNISYDLFNPSIGDFILQKYSKDIHFLCLIFNALDSEKSIYNLKSLAESKVFNIFTVKAIFESLLDKKLNCKKNINYCLVLINTCIKLLKPEDEAKEKISKYFNSINLKEEIIFQIEDFFQIAEFCINEKIFNITTNDFNNFVLEILDGPLDKNELESIDNALFCFDDVPIELADKLKQNVIEYWTDTISDFIKEDGVLYNYSSEENIYDAELEVYSALELNMDYGCVSFSNDELESIASHVDIENIIENNRKNLIYEDDDSYEDWKNFSGKSNILETVHDQIDDLFDRHE